MLVGKLKLSSLNITGLVLHILWLVLHVLWLVFYVPTVFKPLPLPPGSSAGFTRRTRSARLMGWVDGTDDQMGPSIFFILLGYIEHV